MKINQYPSNLIVPFPKTSNDPLNLITPENKTYMKHTGDYLCSYNFENVSEIGDTYSKVPELDGHKSILKINYGFSYSINKFSQFSGTVEFYFRTVDATDKTIMSLKGLEPTPHIYFYVLDDEWYFLNNETFEIIDLPGNYKPSDNKWHHIKIDFECSASGYSGLAEEKWRLTVDGISSTQLNMHRTEINPPTCLIDEIWLASYVDIPNGASYFDAFGYSWDDFYDIGENQNEGLRLEVESISNIDWMGYSLDNQVNITIPRNFTIPMPKYGSHSIQVYANDSFGTIYKTLLQYFTIGPIEIISPNKDSVWEENYSYDIIWNTFLNISHIDLEIYKGSSLKFSDYAINNTGFYEWTVPIGILIGSDWSIKITDSANSTLYGISEYFQILTLITILTPDSSSVWYSGKPNSIMWSTKGNITHVDIELWKGSMFSSSIVNKTVNDGQYTWIIPYEVNSGIDWNIKIINSYNTSIYAVSEYFEIYTKKSLTLTNPTVNTRWQRGTSQYITWTYTGEINTVDIEIFKGGTLKYQILNTENDGAKFWDISLSEEIGKDWNVSITDSTNSSIRDASGLFEIYHHPDILVTNPTDVSRWEPDKSYFITWSVPARSNISFVDIELYKGGVLKYRLGQTENDGKFLWNIPYDPPPGTNWNVKIIDSDNASTYAWSSNFEIYTDKSITILEPTNGAPWPIAEFNSIEWTSTGSISHVDIELIKNNVTKYYFNNTANDGSYDFKIPYYEVPGNDWEIRVMSSDYLGVFGSVTIDVYIPRTITILYPNKPITLTFGDYVDISWTVNGTISSVSIELYRGNDLELVIASSTTNDGRYLWHIISNVVPSNDYKIKITDRFDSSVFDFSDDPFELANDIPGYDSFIILNLIIFISGISIIKMSFKIKKIKKRK